MAADISLEMTPDSPDPAYFSRAIPAVPLEAAQVIEPVGGTRTTTPGQENLDGGRLDIEIIPGQKLRGNLAALAAVQRAAAQWEAHLFDPITVSIEIDLDVAPAGVLGFAIPNEVILPYSEVRAALQTDALAEADDSIVARLPAADSIEFALPPGTEFRGDISVAKANAKAIGLRPGQLDDLFGVADGGIVMSESVPFDFNRNDGIEPGQFDFESVVVHEIGHVLGFLSSTDRFTVGGGPAVIEPTTLDLFRFRDVVGADNPRTPVAFESLRRELRPATPAAIDFILQDDWNLPAIEYPVEFGEPANLVPPDTTNPLDPFVPFGYQASHWLDSDLFGETIGVMVPTFAPQQIVPISNVDLRAFDLIGYNVLPPDQTPVVPRLADDQASVGNQNRVVIDVLANDRNDGLAFELSTFEIVEPPLLGDVQFDPITGLVVYEVQPGTGQDVDSLTYRIANSQGIFGEPAVVTVTIAGSGLSPIAIDDFVLTRQNQSVAFNPLTNDNDDAGLTFANLQVVSGPSNGSITTEDNALRYTPNADFSGTDSLVYEITDHAGLSAQATVEFTIGESLIPPIVPGQPLTLLQRADVNSDRSITALDALMTINSLNRQTSSSTSVPTDELPASQAPSAMDVSGDGWVSPLDALMIINMINRIDSTGEMFFVDSTIGETSNSADEAEQHDEATESRLF